MFLIIYKGLTFRISKLLGSRMLKTNLCSHISTDGETIFNLTEAEVTRWFTLSKTSGKHHFVQFNSEKQNYRISVRLKYSTIAET